MLPPVRLAARESASRLYGGRLARILTSRPKAEVRFRTSVVRLSQPQLHPPGNPVLGDRAGSAYAVSGTAGPITGDGSAPSSRRAVPAPAET